MSLNQSYSNVVRLSFASWRNFHLLIDVARYVGLTCEAFVSRYVRLAYVRRSKQQLVTLIKNGGSLHKSDNLAHLRECNGDEPVTLVELDTGLRQVLGAELCRLAGAPAKTSDGTAVCRGAGGGPARSIDGTVVCRGRGGCDVSATRRASPKRQHMPPQQQQQQNCSFRESRNREDDCGGGGLRRRGGVGVGGTELGRAYRSSSPAARSDSPSRCRKLTDKCVNATESRLSALALANHTASSSTRSMSGSNGRHFGLFVVRSYIKPRMRRTPKNRDKSIKVKGVRLRDSRIFPCSVLLSRSMSRHLPVAPAAAVTDDAAAADDAVVVVTTAAVAPTLTLRKSPLDRAVHRFCAQLHRAAMRRTNSNKNTEIKIETESAHESEIKTRSDGRTKPNRGGRVELGRRGKGPDPILPVLERQKREAAESVKTETEMPRLTCAFDGQ